MGRAYRRRKVVSSDHFLYGGGIRQSPSDAIGSGQVSLGMAEKPPRYRKLTTEQRGASEIAESRRMGRARYDGRWSTKLAGE